MRRLVVGQLVGQAALIGATPLLARQYAPASIGTFQLAMVLGLVLAMIGTQRIDTVLPSATWREVAGLTRRAAFGVAGVAICGGSLGGVLIALTPSAAQVVLMACVLSVAVAAQSVDSALLIRAGELHRLAFRNGLFGLVAALSQVGLGTVWSSAWALAAGIVAGRLAAVVVTRSPRRGPVETPDAPEGNGNLDYGSRASGYNVGAGVLATVSGQGLMFAAAMTLGAGSAGQVAIAQRAASAPLTLMGQGIAQSVAARAAKIVRDGTATLGAQLVADARTLLPIAITSSVLMAAFARLGLEPLLGHGWSDAADVLLVLSCGMWAQLVASPQTAIFPLIGKQRIQMLLEGAKTGLLFAVSALVGVVTGSLVWMAVGASCVLAAGYAVTWACLLREARDWDRAVSETEVDSGAEI